MKSAVAASSAGFVGRPASRRVIPRNARIIGRAEGNIIATIMTTRSAKKRTRSVDRKREGAVSAIRTSAEVHVAYQAVPNGEGDRRGNGDGEVPQQPSGLGRDGLDHGAIGRGR